MLKTRQRPTLKTLSEHTGLSLSTVSLALRGGENLKEDTRLKVMKAAQELGYVPDRAGVKLRTGRSNAVGIVLDGHEDSVGFSRNLIHGISDAVRAEGLLLNVYPEFDRAETNRTIQSLIAGGQVDGLILTHTEPQDARVKMLLEMDFPFVTHGRTELFTPHAYHDFDAAAFVAMAVQQHADRGVGQILAVMAESEIFNHDMLARQFRAECEERGITAEIYSGPRRGRDHIRGLRELGLSLANTGVEAILCDSELTAITVATGLRDAGISVGDDMPMVAKQTSDLLYALFPEITGIYEDVYASGRELARLLMQRIAGVAAGELQTLAAPVVYRG